MSVAMLPLRVTVALLVGFALVGCTGKKSATSGKATPERDPMMLTDIELPEGKARAGLSVWVPKNDEDDPELEVTFETPGENPKPVCLPESAVLTAQITRARDGKQTQWTLTPAEKQDRPTDPAGKCSRFTVEIEWLEPDDKLEVVLTVKCDGHTAVARWWGFHPRQFTSTDD